MHLNLIVAPFLSHIKMVVVVRFMMRQILFLVAFAELAMSTAPRMRLLLPPNFPRALGPVGRQLYAAGNPLVRSALLSAGYPQQQLRYFTTAPSPWGWATSTGAAPTDLPPQAPPQAPAGLSSHQQHPGGGGSTSIAVSPRGPPTHPQAVDFPGWRVPEHLRAPLRQSPLVPGSVRVTRSQLDFLAKHGCFLEKVRAGPGRAVAGERKKRVRDFILSAPAGVGFEFAELNREALRQAGCYSDDLHVENGGNSFRKAGAVRASEMVDALDFSD